MQLKKMFLMVLLMLPVGAQAAQVNPELLKDYIGLATLLKSHGVEPVEVDWLPIEEACLGLKTETNAVDYNQCRFTMAVDASQFTNDSTACDAASMASYPESGRTVQKTKHAAGVSTTVVAQLKPEEVKAGRVAAYDACMHEHQWVNPNHWQMGRRK